jgi:hypothetical protein
VRSPAAAENNESQLRVMAVIAFAVFYSNYMVAPLIPALSREFSVTAYQMGWLIPGFLIPYGISTLVYRSVIGSLGANSSPRDSSLLRHDDHVAGLLRRVVADTPRRADSIGRGMWRNRHYLSGGCRGPLSL